MKKNKEGQKGKAAVKFKTPAHFRLTFLNENKLTQVWSIKMSRVRVILSLAILVLAVICIGASLISFTPLRTLLPGYLRTTERKEFVAANERIDSLLQVVAVNDRYINNLNSILAGEINADSLLVAPVDPQPLDTALLIGPSKAERDFVAAYTAHEGFSIENATTVLPDAPAFVLPVRDAIIHPSSNPLKPSFEFTENKVGVFAIARGVIVDVHESEGEGFTVLIQHPDGYLSRYDGVSSVNYSAGKEVASGTRLGAYLRDSGPKFSFTLYRDGNPLNPTHYMQF